MQPQSTLARKLILIGACFLVLALASIGLTLLVTWKTEGGAAAVNEAGRMRMLTWRMAAAIESGQKVMARDSAQQIDASLVLLRNGDPERPLFVPWDPNLHEQFTKVEQQWNSLRATALSDAKPAKAISEESGRFVGSVDMFVASIERQISRWTSILDLFQMAMMALAIGSAVILMYVGYLFVLDPLARLAAGIKRLEQGELSARVTVASTDEFGALAGGFNRMADNLQSLYQDLEGKVREKTANLQVERERFASLYEVSNFLSKAGTLDDLAHGFARHIRRIAGADAAAVRWSNEANQHYLLLASDCLPEAMARDEHCLLTGSCLCSQGDVVAGAKIIPILSANPPPLDHCARAGYETLVSVPVQFQGRLLGEVDLFYRKPAAPSNEERLLLETLASHLANAMEGRRATALEREAAVANERTLLAGELHDSIAQSLAFMSIQVQLLRDAIKRKDQTAVENVIAELDTGVRESIGDVRELLIHFRTRANEEDIEPALRSTLSKFEHQTGLKAHLMLSGHALPLDPDVQIQLLHIVQEALSNVRKHANATAVWVDVQRQPRWRFEVLDDGEGFENSEDAGVTHVGLRIMRERAQRIGAQLRVDSAPGAGTRVTVTLPPSARADEPIASGTFI